MIKDIIISIKLLFRKDKELYYDLKKILGFYPNNIELYKTALLHKSIMHRNNKGKPVNNERLEFLGDAVLDAVVGDIVYRRYPGKREGFLTNTRSKLVQRETLGKLANEMGITRLVLSSGRSQSHNSYLGGNAFEALVGAMYLDRGYDTCMKFMEKHILGKLINIDKVAYKEVNFKSKLLEWTQKNRIKLEYVEVEQSKDENGSPVFIYKVKLETVDCESGKGYSKKESQQQASKLTLEKLKKDSKFLDSIFAAKTERTKMEEEPVMIVPDTEEKVELEETPIVEETIEQKPKTEHPERTERNKQHQPRPKKEKSDNNTEQKVEKKENKQENKPEKKDDTPAQKPEKKESRQPRRNSKKQNIEENDEFDLSDISAKKLSREEIIALAEEEAFKE